MSSIKEINSAMLNPNNSKSRSILRAAQDKGYITEGNKWNIKGLKALFDLSKNAQSQQDHAAEQERKEKENAALEYIQSLISR